jgi:hypothetical protein
MHGEPEATMEDIVSVETGNNNMHMLIELMNRLFGLD